MDKLQKISMLLFSAILAIKTKAVDKINDIGPDKFIRPNTYLRLY